MEMHDVITLVNDDPAVRGVYEDATPQLRNVFCTIKSVDRRESYEAMSHGKNPEIVFELTQAFEYNGEKRVICHDQEYEILRSYVTRTDGIELVAERVKG